MIMTTETVAVLPIIKALAQSIIFASSTPNLSDTWYQQFLTTNSQQQTLINTYVPAYKELSHFTHNELNAWASRNHEELNDILATKDFNIRLEPFNGGFGVVSILDITTKWLHAGTPTTIVCPDNNETYHGVAISKGFKIFSSANHEHPIAQLYTQSGDVIYLTKATEQQSGFELLNTINNIKQNIQEIAYDYNGKLIFPKACVDHQPDVSWLIGMSFDTYTLEQAKQQTKFNLDETGAEVKSAVAIGWVESVCCFNDFIIDQPYIVWWERKDVSIPVVAALIAQDSWQKK